MQNKRNIAHNTYNDANIKLVNLQQYQLKELGLTQYTNYYSNHRAKALVKLYIEIASDLDTLIKFKDFLYEFDYTDFLKKIDIHFYLFGSKENITERERIMFLGLYKYFYVTQIKYLVSCLSIVIDEKMGRLRDDEKHLVSPAKEDALKIIDTINKYGDVATEFLIRVLGYNFIEYVGEQKYIVTSSLIPEKDFEEYIAKGYQVVRYSRLVYDDEEYPFHYREREHVNNILEPLYFPLPDYNYPRNVKNKKLIIENK